MNRYILFLIAGYLYKLINVNATKQEVVVGVYNDLKDVKTAHSSMDRKDIE